MSEEELDNVENIENESVLSQDEIDAILAEYKHQQMLEQMVGPLTSMIVHVAGILLVVIMISTGGKPQESKTIVEMMPPEKPVEVEDPPDIEPPEPEPIEVEVPEIDIAPPSDNTAGAPEGDVIEPAGEQFSIPPSNSPFRLKIPAGNSRGSFGFGKAGVGNGGGRGGTGGGGAPYLNGRFYDLKQTPQRTGTGMNNDGYCKVMSEYMTYLTSGSKGTSPLTRFYAAERNGKPVVLRTGGLYLKYANNRAADAPKAFAVEDIVKPSQWLSHYQGSLVIGNDCECRFWGEGDDFISVLIDGKPVLVTGYWDPGRYGAPGFQATERRKGTMGGRGLEGGTWISLKKGQKVKIDILFGEIPGGGFGGMLLLEKKGEKYEIGKNGNPKLPIFSTVEVLPDRLPEGEVGEAVKEGIISISGGMLTRTTGDVFRERIEKQELRFE